jgi:hypothetical protein
MDATRNLFFDTSKENASYKGISKFDPQQVASENILKDETIIAEKNGPTIEQSRIAY